MDAMNAILTRRSIRKYTKQPISKETIRKILEAAMSAPSAGNERPWHFIIIDDPLVLKTIPTFHQHARMLKEASFAILICGDKNLVKHGEMWVQDCSASTENILIAVQASRLGAVWLGVYPREERISGLRKLLNLPEHVMPFSLVSIGYPAEQKGIEDRYDSSRIHHNSW